MSWRTLLATARENGVFQAIDIHFARLICRMEGRSDDESPLAMWAALVSQASSGRNNVCVDVETVKTPEGLVEWLNMDNRERLTAAEIPADWNDDFSTYRHVIGHVDETNRPLILDNHRLYLQRDWQYERIIGDTVAAKCAGMVAAPASVNPLEYTTLALNQEQQLAARSAMTSDFQIITGGPGTGKTTIVAVILAMLLKEDPTIRIALCAPTGKAQARMEEALRDEAKNLSPNQQTDLSDKIVNLKASTIHRLLGYVPGSVDFRHHADNPLPHDLVIVDEASMIPQSLMAKLLSALSTSTRIVLLGDRDQLASVEAGAVLGDLCDALDETGRVSRLKISQRFKTGGEIDQFKRVLETNGTSGTDRTDEEAWKLLPEGGKQLCRGKSLERNEGEARLFNAFGFQSHEKGKWSGWIDDTGSYFKQNTLPEAWERFESFRILCAVNRGATGVDQLNRDSMKALGIVRKSDHFPKGFPVIVTENDYGIDLFNGDVGMAWPAIDASTPATGDACEKAMRIFFPALGPDGTLIWRGVLPTQLPSHQAAFALSVHKSQGSGFERVLVVLPDHESRILTRELIYTAVTRAKSKAEIWASEKVFKAAVAYKTVRTSGLTTVIRSKLDGCSSTHITSPSNAGFSASFQS